MTDVILVLTTVPVGDAGESIARTLVEERLAACVNLQPAMTSHYVWNGTVERGEERQLVAKTTRARLPALRERLEQLHSYELPELIVIEVGDGSAAYLEWVEASVRP